MLGFITRVDKWDEGLTLETSALESLYGGKLPYQPLVKKQTFGSAALVFYWNCRPLSY